MNPKVFLVLAAITLATTVAATFAVLSQPAVTTLQFVDEPAFPALRENPDAVAKLVVATPEGTITLVRETGDRWAALERYGYPVDRKRVRDLVVALADMRLIERKTAQPERYARLQVEAPDAEGAQSQLVRLESADGKVLAEAIIGKQRDRLTGTEPSGTYLRHPDEAQSWLASGGLQIDREIGRWLQDEIVDLDPAAIRRIVVERAGEPSYSAERAQPDDDLRLAGLAQDEALREDADLGQLTGALSGVRLEDVRPRAQLTWPPEQHTVRIQTFGGVELTVRMAQIDDAYWATFDARAVAPADGAASAERGEAEPQETAEGDQGGAVQAAGGAAEDSGGSGTGEQVAAGAQAPGDEPGGPEQGALDEAAEPDTAAQLDPDQLNRRLGKWAYQIPEHLFNRLSTARSELVSDREGTS